MAVCELMCMRCRVHELNGEGRKVEYIFEFISMALACNSRHDNMQNVFYLFIETNTQRIYNIHTS